MALWTAIEETAIRDTFPYDFPIEWGADGNVGGWDSPTRITGNWVARTEDGELLEAVLFDNQATGAIEAYVVAFSTSAILVSEAAGVGIAGWDMGGGYYVGVWDGFLQVTTSAIASAVSPPESGVSLSGGLLQYTPPPTITGGWTAVASAS